MQLFYLVADLQLKPTKDVMLLRSLRSFCLCLAAGFDFEDYEVSIGNSLLRMNCWGRGFHKSVFWSTKQQIQTHTHTDPLSVFTAAGIFGADY